MEHRAGQREEQSTNSSGGNLSCLISDIHYSGRKPTGGGCAASGLQGGVEGEQLLALGKKQAANLAVVVISLALLHSPDLFSDSIDLNLAGREC